MTPPSIAEQNALTVECPTCKAAAHVWCTEYGPPEDTKPRPILHRARAVAARKRAQSLRTLGRRFFSPKQR